MKDVRVFVTKFTGMKPGDKVLDVCCGTGDQVFYYNKEGAIAYGIDLDSKMIRMAEKDKRRKNNKNVSFQIADATKLPFEDNFFDYVSISLALHEKERDIRDKVISEMKRVVKKEGSIVFIDFKIPFPNNFYSYLIKIVEYFNGKYHFRYFKDYIKQGGLDKLLEKNKLREEKRSFLKYNNIVMIKTGKIGDRGLTEY
jgi:ubiquinone/menaquinone biosynthesis C-methylase UbiE